MGKLSLVIELLSQVDSMDNFVNNSDEIVLSGIKTILEEAMEAYHEIYNEIDSMSSSV